MPAPQSAVSPSVKPNSRAAKKGTRFNAERRQVTFDLPDYEWFRAAAHAQSRDCTKMIRWIINEWREGRTVLITAPKEAVTA